MMKVWKSIPKNHVKVGFFWATVESVLLYGAECWKMTGKMRNRLDGTHNSIPMVLIYMYHNRPEPERHVLHIFVAD